MREKVDLKNQETTKNRETDTVSLGNEPVNKTSVVVLAVGDVAQWRTSGRNLPWDTQITFAGFEEVDAGFLNRVKPDIVLSPLLCRTFDCSDLAQSLQSTGFSGRYRIMSPRIPRPTVVLTELRSLYPSLDIDIILDSVAASNGVN